MKTYTNQEVTRIRPGISILALCAALTLSTAACAREDAGAPEAAQPAATATQDEASAGQSETANAVKADIASETSKQVDDKRAELVEEAAAALAKTREAIAALDKNEPDAALAALEQAAGKLDIIIARDSDLALAPVEVAAIRRDLIASVDSIRKLRNNIKELVKQGEIQEARPLIENFGSEIVITTTYIPLATYPDAIAKTAALIDEGDIDEAKITLDAALSTLVVADKIVPLPLLRAQAYLDAAEAALEAQAPASESVENGEQPEQSGLSLQADQRDEADVKALLENAAHEIELAKAFGYGDKTLYRQLQDDIKTLQQRIGADGEAGGLFASIRRQISDLMPKDGE